MKKGYDVRTVGMESWTIFDAWLADIFKNTLGVGGVNRVLRVPEYILNSNREIKLSFLAGLVDTDGTFGTRQKNQIRISSKSPEFLSDILILAKSMGVEGKFTSCHTRRNGEILRTYWELCFRTEGKNKLIDLEFHKYLTVERKKPVKKGFPRKTNETPKILRIEPAGKRKMVDITVEREEEFSCNGLRVHNCFAVMSNEPSLKKVFQNKDLDFYSQVYCDVGG